jgi:hypothetical protein
VTDEVANSPSWSRFNERVSVTLWTSFLAACLETVVFFACFDPNLLGNIGATPAWLAGRWTAYATGFFFFWAFTFVGSILTAIMLDSSPNASAKRNQSPP